MSTRQDLILATIRTAVPAAIGWVLAWLIARIPFIAQGIASIDAILAQSAPGYTVAVILNALCIGGVVALYYWLARKLGARFPSLERWLLGRSATPTYIDAGSADNGPVVITSLPEARVNEALVAKYAGLLGLDRSAVSADYEAARARLTD